MNKPRQLLVEEYSKKILKDFKYNDLIPYTYLENLIGYEKHEMAFAVILQLIKNTLIKSGYVLRVSINQGYKVLHPSEIADYVMNKYIQGSLNKLGKGYEILSHTNRDILNNEQKEFLDQLTTFAIRLYDDNKSKIDTIHLKFNIARTKQLNK